MLPEEELVGLLIGLLVGGQHTSNVTSTWLGIYLFANPDELRKVVEGFFLKREIRSPFSAEQRRLVPHGKELTLSDVKQMVCLERALKETLRLRPPLTMIVRKVMDDVSFNGYNIPRGDYVAASPLMNHRIEEFWSEPNQFKPDRFSPEIAEDKKNREFSFLCFAEDLRRLRVYAVWQWTSPVLWTEIR